MKKYIYIVIFDSLLFAMILLLSFVIVRLLPARSIEKTMVTRQHQIQESQVGDWQVGMVGETQVAAFMPVDGQGQRLPVIEEEMVDTVVKEAGVSTEAKTPNRLLVLYPQEEKTELKNLKRFTVQVQAYQSGMFGAHLKKEYAAKNYYLTADNQVLLADGFFKKPNGAARVIRETIKKSIAGKKMSAKELSAVNTLLEQLTVDQVDFTFEDEKIHIPLDKSSYHLESIDIPVNQLYDYVDMQYLPEKDQTAYQELLAVRQEEESKKKQLRVALTFDDGPNAATTPEALDILKQYNVKATFFIQGKYIPGNEDILKRELAEGHELGNHSWNHPDLNTLSKEEVKQEIDDTTKAIKEATGYDIKLVRAPYGNSNKMVKDVIQKPTIYWDVDSKDWESLDPEAILKEIQAQTRRGSIILLHDIHPTTVEALPRVIEYLQSQGYQFVTVSELLGDNLDPDLIYDRQDETRLPTE